MRRLINFKNIEQRSRPIIEVIPMVFENNQATQRIVSHHLKLIPIFGHFFHHINLFQIFCDTDNEIYTTSELGETHVDFFRSRK